MVEDEDYDKGKRSKSLFIKTFGYMDKIKTIRILITDPILLHNILSKE